MTPEERKSIDERILSAPGRGAALSDREVAEHLLAFVSDADARYLADEIYDPPAEEIAAEVTD